MANWKNTLSIADLHDGFDEVEGGAEDRYATEAGQTVAERLLVLYPETHVDWDDELQSIVDRFDDAQSVSDYDEALGALYDWADVDHRLCVKTF